MESVLLHYESKPNNDEQTSFIEYNCYLLLNLKRVNVLVTSYIPLDSQQLKIKANEQLRNGASSIQ